MAGSGSQGDEFPAEELQVQASMIQESGQTSCKMIGGDSIRIDIRVENDAASTESGAGVSMEERFNSLMNPGDGDRKPPPPKWPRIRRVPQMLRCNKENFRKQFEPRVVSLGPYHHHKPELKPWERLKREMTRQFILDSGQRIGVLRKIEAEIPELRKCYDDCSAVRRYSDQDLAWMMLLDGCYLLHYIYCYYYAEHGFESEDLPPMEDQDSTFVQQDLLLLENQIPFRVLEILLASRFKEEERMKILESFINQMTELTPPSVKKHGERKEKTPPPPPAHLLDLLRRRLLGDDEKQTESKCKSIHKCMCNEKADDDCREGWNSFRSVSELKAAGVWCQRSRSNSWRDISFKSYLFFGVLRLPRIMVDDHTRSRFLNLIAYEMSSEGAVRREVISFLCFLDDLIDYREDVRELRRRGIVLNLMGSDDEVATLFNQIATDLDDVNAHCIVKHAIQRHYDAKFSTWMTEGFYGHFSSPWTFLAFVGILLGLFLTAAQTWFAFLEHKKKK